MGRGRTFESMALALFACAALAAFAAAPRCVFAQGGPPMVTDDPETPGNGKWEINLAALGFRTHAGRWEVSAPDADINYGWGDHMQLKLDVPWTFAREPGERWKSGLGAGNVGVKWRFVDSEDRGFSMSTYPQYLSGWLASSRNRGITSPEKEFFLPVEVATEAGGFGLDGEVGRNFVQHGQDQWVVGGIVAHACGAGRECLFEVHEAHAPHESHTLVNLGLHWKMSESLVLLASAGRELGPRIDDRRGFLFYLGFQLLR
jgi:hypothetical protein